MTSPQLLSPEEVDTLLRQLIEQCGDEPPTDADAIRVIRWAEVIRVQATVLELVFAGNAVVRVDADGQPHVRLTPVGEGLLGMNPWLRSEFTSR